MKKLRPVYFCPEWRGSKWQNQDLIWSLTANLVFLINSVVSLLCPFPEFLLMDTVTLKALLLLRIDPLKKFSNWAFPSDFNRFVFYPLIGGRRQIGGSDGKEFAHNAGDLGLIPGEGNSNPLQYSWLGNPMDRGAWWATVHVVGRKESDPTERVTPFTLGNSAGATGLEKVSFHSTLKEGQCQRIFKLLYSCAHFNPSKVMLNPSV